MKSYIGIWRSARRTIEWGTDYANGGDGVILGEATTIAEAYTAAGAYDKANGGDGDIGRRWRVPNGTGCYCVECQAELAPWETSETTGRCARCVKGAQHGI